MNALKTTLRSITLMAALAVALPALRPKPAAARPACVTTWVGYPADTCTLCTLENCYGWTCNIDGEVSQGSGCY